MFLVELVLQGVRGFRELARLKFQSGFNFVYAGNESGKSTAVDAVQRLLFPSSREGLLEGFISRHTRDVSRAALMLYSDDGAYYRVIQDFSKRAVNISKYNAASKEFSLLHKDWDSAAQFLAGLTAGISENDFSEVFIFRRGPRAAQAASAPSPEAAPRPAPGGAVSNAPGSVAARIAELRESLQKAEEAADTEYRAQSARLALNDVQKKIAELENIEREKEEADSALKALKGCDTLPEDLAPLIEDHERRQGRKLAETDELTREIEGLKAQLAEHPAVNLFTNKLFILGALLGGGSIFAGTFVLTEAQAYYFPIGILLSMGLVATAWYRSSGKNSQRKIIVKEAAALEKEIVGLDRRFEQESAPLKAFMKATGSATPAELKDKADNYRRLLSLSSEQEEHRQRILGGQSPETLRQEFDKRQQAVLELEKAARDLALYNVDTYSIRQDIERLEEELPEDSGADAGAHARDEGVRKPPASVEPVGFPAALDAAGRIGGGALDILLPAVETAAGKNIFAITGGRYAGIGLGAAEGAPVVRAKNGSAVSFEELSHGTREAVSFCLGSGLVEALAGKRRLPYLLDDPFVGFDPARQKAACQVLRALGAKTQVILFSSNPALKAEGDVAAELA